MKKIPSVMRVNTKSSLKELEIMLKKPNEIPHDLRDHSDFFINQERFFRFVYNVLNSLNDRMTYLEEHEPNSNNN